MNLLNDELEGVWREDAKDLVVEASASTNVPHGSDIGTPNSGASSSETYNANPTAYGVSVQQLDALSAMAYLVGSPFQRQQVAGTDATHPALLVAAKLLQQGVDPERIVELVECRYHTLSC